MKKQLPELTGKGVYMPPTTETMVVLFTSQAICGSPTDPRSSSTEEWDEEDLSML